MQERNSHGRKVKVFLFGKKSADVFSRLKNVEVIGSAAKLGDIPSAEDVLSAAQIAINEFEEGEIGNVYLYANEFINTMSQSPFEKRILPIASIEGKDANKKVWDYICLLYTSPSPRDV